MEFFAKVMLYALLGATLVAANVWYVRLVYQAIAGGDLVIAPVQVVAGGPATPGLDETMARMLIARLQDIEWDLEHSQTDLKKSDEAAKSTKVTPATGAAPTLASGITGVFGTPKTAGINAQLFEPTKIDVKVGGVDVGGLLPRVQRWFVEDRILSFSVSYQKDTAIVSGNIDALGNAKTKPLWFKVENATPASIVDELAFALIQRKWATDTARFGELTSDEFKSLVNSVAEVAKINRRVVSLNVPAKTEFASLLSSVGPLAEKMKGWNELTYFAATIAEGAENSESALSLYRQLREHKADLAADVLNAKITALEAIVAKVKPAQTQSAMEKLTTAATYATNVLNKLFGYDLPVPKIELLRDDERNAYWDGEKVFIPPVVQDLPDIVYHEVAWPFVQKAWKFQYSGQSGALAMSYTDALTSFIKQTKLNQSANDADWEIAPGAIAWVSGNPAAIATDKRPLRSLKSPGSAYDDKVIGKDQQPSHIRDLVTTADDFGGMHVNSGIPNKAFYEAAISLGTDKAASIWIKSLPRFAKAIDFAMAAKEIHATAKSVYGATSTEAETVKAAWEKVGLAP